LEADCQKKIPLVGEKSVGKGRVCFESSISRGFSSKGSRLLFEVLAQKISLSQSPSSKQGNLLKEKRDDDHNMPPFEKDGQEQCPLRRQTKREMLLRLDKSQLTKQMSFRGNHCDEILHVARDANSIIRSHYKDCIHYTSSWKKFFPLIIASDHEHDGHSGVGSTLTLYSRADGSITTQKPALGTYYELYKTCSHFF